jgi:acyl carrier protein
MREKIKEIVFATIKEFNEETDLPIDVSTGEQTRLYGGGGVLSSLNLVALIVMIEEAIETEFDTSIALADEKAMSRRVSPFASVGTLVDYLSELLQTVTNG